MTTQPTTANPPAPDVVAEFQVDAGHLRDWLTPVMAHLDKSDIMPSLGCVRIHVSKSGALVASATNRFTAAVHRLHLVSGPKNDPVTDTPTFDIQLHYKDLDRVLTMWKVRRTTRSGRPVLSVTVRDGDVTFTGPDQVQLRVPRQAYTIPNVPSLVIENLTADCAPMKDMGINPAYLALAVKGYVPGSEGAIVRWAGNMKPLTLQLGSDYVVLVMPVRLQDDDHRTTTDNAQAWADDVQVTK